MIKSSLLSIISKLNSQEFREFGEYVRSPFFNKNEGVIKLYDYIALNYPEFKEKKMEKGVIYGSMYPGVKYNESFMKTLMFNLSRLAEDYLSYSRFRKDPVDPSLYLIWELYDRDIEKLFLRKLKLAEENLEHIKYKNENYFLNKYNIQSLKESHWINNQRFLNYKDLPEQDTYTKSKSILTFFFIKILSEYLLVYSQKRIVNFEYEFEFLDNLLEYIKVNYPKYKSPLLEIVLNQVLMLKEGKSEYYKKAKELIANEKNSLRWLDRFNAMSALASFAVEHYYRGDMSYMKERFELHKIVLDNKLYTATEGGGCFEEQLFINMIVVGTQMKEIEWCERFINQYKKFLDPEKDKNPLFISCSRLSFVKGKYEDALQHLSKITSLDKAYYKVSVKNLTLMIYYELGWDVQASEIVDTYRHFLSRDTILPPVQKERSVNFLKFYNDLLKLKSKNNSKLTDNLRFDLSRIYNVIERQWLLEKVEELCK